MRFRNRLASSLVFLALALPVSSQLPDTPTGRRGNAVIAVLRGGPDAVTESFFRDHFSARYLAEQTIEERIQWLAGMLESLGEVELQGVEKTGAFAATIIASSAETGARVEIAYALEDEEPHAIASFEIAEAGEAIAPMSADEMVGKVGEFLDEVADRDEFSGVVLVARNEEVLFEQAYGLANRRFEVANRPNTPFNLGSINKIFTKIALAQLAADGKLSFDETVATYLPDYPNPDVAKRITLSQVAKHTAGLGDIFTDEFATALKSRYRSPSDYFELFANEALLFEPGEGQRYSNGGYMVLGAIIEAVSGETYEDYVQSHIFGPAGMADSGSHHLDASDAAFATGYTRMGEDHESAGPLRENTFSIPFTGTSAGGGYSTARDLLRFRHALVGHELIDTRYTAWVLGDELPESPPEKAGRYGMGFAGGGPGVNALFEIEGDWTIIVLANLDPPSAGDVAAQLRAFVGAVLRSEGEAR